MNQSVKHRGIYVVYAREFVRSGEKVFKVGKTSDMDNRMTGYPKGSQLVAFRQCAVGIVELGWAETNVLTDLRCDNRFRACTEFGREYFEGDCTELVAAVFRSLERFEVPWVSSLGGEKRQANPEAEAVGEVEAKSKAEAEAEAVAAAASQPVEPPPLPTKPLTTDEVEDLIAEFVQARQGSVASKRIKSRDVFHDFKQYIGAQSTRFNMEHAQFSKMICVLTGSRSVPGRNGLLVDRYIEFPSIHVSTVDAGVKDAGIATSYVKRFLALGPDDEQAVTKGGEVVYLAKVVGVVTAVKAINEAYAQFMRDHYEGVRSNESINRQVLELARYKVVDEHKVCHTCLRMFIRGHQHPSQRRRCCDKYDSATRNNLVAVVGYSLERTPAVEAVKGVES